MKRSEGKLISLQGKPFTLEVTDVKARTGVSASRTFYMSFSSQVNREQCDFVVFGSNL